MIVLIGAVCGLLGCLPPGFLLERVLKGRTRVQVARGIASILVSFGFMSAALVAVRAAQRDKVLVFGVAMMAAFLLFWGVEALRIWLAIRASEDSEGRN